MPRSALHFSVAFGVTYALTDDVLIGSAVALVEPAVNTGGYHIHERLWERFPPHRAAPSADAGCGAMPCAA
jgi:uncharacterized membrane protein